MKKAEITWEAIVKIILALIVLILLASVSYIFKDKIAEFINTLINAARLR